jgi:hypothetical protein
VNEIMAKLTQNEKLIGLGAIVVVAAWLLGWLITDEWYSHAGAGGTGLLAALAAAAAIVVLYLKYAPGTKITWPAPVATILLGLAAIVGVLALIGLLQSFTYDPSGGLCDLAGSLAGRDVCPNKPVTLYVTALAVLVGGAIMCWGAFQDWSASNKAA